MDSRTRSPLDVAALTSLLADERDLLERLLFRHTELRLLVEAGEARYLGKAIDEIEALEVDLGTLEILRAMTVEEIAAEHGLPTDPALGEIVEVMQEPSRTALSELSADLVRLMSAIEEHRARTAALASLRAERLARASSGGASADGYRSDGSAGLAAGA